jgi:hypothetical protein
MRARPLAIVLVGLAGVGGLSGCPSRAGDARDLAVAAETDAVVVVNEVLVQLAAGQLQPVLARLCDQGQADLARAHRLLAPALSRADLEIARVEPTWVGTDPFFFVEVKSRDGAFVHGFGVDVRSGCLDRAGGATDVDGTDAPSPPIIDAGVVAP